MQVSYEVIRYFVVWQKKSQITRDVDPTLQSVVDFVLEWIGCRSIIVKSETRSLEKDADCDNRERDDSSACKINTEFLSLMCGIEWHEIPIADGVSFYPLRATIIPNFIVSYSVEWDVKILPIVDLYFIYNRVHDRTSVDTCKSIWVLLCVLYSKKIIFKFQLYISFYWYSRVFDDFTTMCEW